MERGERGGGGYERERVELRKDKFIEGVAYRLNFD